MTAEELKELRDILQWADDCEKARERNVQLRKQAKQEAEKKKNEIWKHIGFWRQCRAMTDFYWGWQFKLGAWALPSLILCIKMFPILASFGSLGSLLFFGIGLFVWMLKEGYHSLTHGGMD